ncbi:hypothetical protein [Crocosphaera subtropica]|uniref:hypothetical protein n=1 Tax=Crocosphaera subtropica TaxID=2546360 RepID=UPI00023147B3|nr:hypothetical protein [Crocosphaera subtropica]
MKVIKLFLVLILTLSFLTISAFADPISSEIFTPLTEINPLGNLNQIITTECDTEVSLISDENTKGPVSCGASCRGIDQYGNTIWTNSCSTRCDGGKCGKKTCTKDSCSVQCEY